MDTVLTVVAADGSPIAGAGVTGASTASDGNGRVGLSLAWPGDTAVAVSKPGYVPLTVTIRSGPSGWQSDDPGTTFSPNGQVAVALGRSAAAPTVTTAQVTVDTLLRQYMQQSPVQTAFVAEDGEYLSVEAQAPISKIAPEVQFHAAIDPKGLLAAGSGRLPGWEALNHTVTQMSPTKQGRFAWLVWGGSAVGQPSQKRFLVAAWRPKRTTAAEPSGSRDVIIFLTPPTTAARGYLPDTAPFEGEYPFGLHLWQGKPDQPYTQIADHYLFGGLDWIAYQLLAAGRDALLVVPVIPAGNIDILQRPEVLCRLALEVILWEHRDQGGQPDPPSAVVDKAPTLQMTGAQASEKVMPQTAVPKLGSVVLAGYSQGVSYVKGVMQALTGSTVIGTRSSADEAANPFEADRGVFAQAWQEIWDFDGTTAGIPLALGGPTNWARTLEQWQKVGSHRLARCYHSDESWQWSWTYVNALAVVTGGPSVSKPNWAGAAESYGPSGSAAWLPTAFLARNPPTSGWNALTSQSGSPPDAPLLWDGDAHRTTLRVGLANAASMSALAKL
jgi:hypothetical protein